MTTTADTASRPRPIWSGSGPACEAGGSSTGSRRTRPSGNPPARRSPTATSICSIFAEHLGFAIWVLWTIVVINLGNIGITMSVPELFWLTAVPNLIGSALRLPYTFAVPRFGGRLWTMISAALLLIPTLLLAVVVPSGWLAGQSHDMQLWVLLFCAATAGLGGGNFSSSMFNISFFYPERKKGLALGLNAAGGNLGVAAAQLLVPLALIIGVPADTGEAARPPGAHGQRRSDVAAAHRRGDRRRLLLHGQPDGGQGAEGAVHPGSEDPPDVGDVVPLHHIGNHSVNLGKRDHCVHCCFPALAQNMPGKPTILEKPSASAAVHSPAASPYTPFDTVIREKGEATPATNALPGRYSTVHFARHARLRSVEQRLDVATDGIQVLALMDEIAIRAGQAFP